MSMPRAAMSVATRARMSPLLKPDSAWVRADWLLLPCSAIALMPFLVRNSATLLAPNLVRVNTSTWLQLCSWMMCASSCFFLARLTGWVTWVMRCTVELRGVTWMLCGLRSSRSASSRISSLKVAENSRLCFSLGTSARIFFTSGRKPMSSMRSASSSTRISHGGQVQHALALQVEQAAGRGHQDVDAGLELGDLRVHADAAEDHGGGQLAGTCRRCGSTLPPARRVRAWA